MINFDAYGPPELFWGLVSVFLALLIFWMVIAWRAMKALERLARNSDEGIEALRAWWRERRREAGHRHEPGPPVDPE